MSLIIVCCFLLPQEKQTPQQQSPARKRIVAKYDTNGDGRLDAKERETLRKSGGKKSRGKGRPKERQDLGPALEKQFDKDKDGKLSDAEYRAAEGGLRAKWEQLIGEFEAYKDGRLVVANLNKMEAAAKKDEIKDFPPALYGWIYFVRSADKRGRKDKQEEEIHPLAKFDINKDGKLDAQELMDARKALASRPKKRKQSDKAQ